MHETKIELCSHCEDDEKVRLQHQRMKCLLEKTLSR
jgi:hypothetical protein